MKFGEICATHIDHIPFQCGDKLAGNGEIEINRRLNPIKRNQK
jgi:hypothetical protein